MPLDVVPIYSPSITLNLRNIFLIYIERNFSWTNQILQKNFFPWFKCKKLSKLAFILAFTTNAITWDVLSSIFPDLVVMFLDYHRTVFTFISWLDLVGNVVAFFGFSFNKSSNHFKKNRHMATDITRFEKHLERSSGHTLNFYQNLVKYHFKNIIFELISHSVFYDELVYKLRRFKGAANFVS